MAAGQENAERKQDYDLTEHNNNVIFVQTIYTSGLKHQKNFITKLYNFV